MEEKSTVKVGSKSKADYVSAILFCLDNFGHAELRGLGKKQSKVLEIKEMAEEIDKVSIENVESINVNGSAGLEVKIKQKKEASE